MRDSESRFNQGKWREKAWLRHPVGINQGAVTFRAWSLACSSSRACCFSFSSILLKEMPVEDRELTALDRVDALQNKEKAPT